MGLSGAPESAPASPRVPWGASKAPTEGALARILSAFSGFVERGGDSRDTPVLKVSPGKLTELCLFLREDPEFKMDQLVLVTGIHKPGRSPDFEVAYQLRSLAAGLELQISCGTPGPQPAVPSLVSVWPGADWLERETYDLVGIHFEGHPDLRRILMAEGTLGHPLRKDFPRRAPKFSMRRGGAEGLPDIIEDSPA